MVLRYISSKWKILKQTQLHYVGVSSKDAPADNVKKTGLYRYAYDFSVKSDSTDAADILDVH